MVSLRTFGTRENSICWVVLMCMFDTKDNSIRLVVPLRMSSTKDKNIHIVLLGVCTVKNGRFRFCFNAL
jgi:hypothetical protein